MKLIPNSQRSFAKDEEAWTLTDVCLKVVKRRPRSGKIGRVAMGHDARGSGKQHNVSRSTEKTGRKKDEWGRETI